MSSHRQTDPSAFEMPVSAPRLIYSAAVVQGWYLLHWFEVTPFAESRAILSRVLDRLASGALCLPPAKRHRPLNIADALRDADGAPRDDFSGGSKRGLRPMVAPGASQSINHRQCMRTAAHVSCVLFPVVRPREDPNRGDNVARQAAVRVASSESRIASLVQGCSVLPFPKTERCSSRGGSS